jgi:hypothetical protein
VRVCVCERALLLDSLPSNITLEKEKYPILATSCSDEARASTTSYCSCSEEPGAPACSSHHDTIAAPPAAQEAGGAAIRAHCPLMKRVSQKKQRPRPTVRSTKEPHTVIMQDEVSCLSSLAQRPARAPKTRIRKKEKQGGKVGNRSFAKDPPCPRSSSRVWSGSCGWCGDNVLVKTCLS